MEVVQLVEVAYMLCIVIYALIPGLVGEITVSITKENNFFIFPVQKGTNFIKFIKVSIESLGGLYQAKRRNGRGGKISMETSSKSPIGRSLLLLNQTKYLA